MHCDICGSDAWYVCGRSGRPVCPLHARIEVVSKLSFGSSSGLSVREALPPDYEKIGHIAKYFWSKHQLNCLDKEYDVLDLSALVVSSSGHVSGVLSYALEGESLVTVMLRVLPGYQGLGAGSMLLDAVKEKAKAEGKTSVLSCASNDDLSSIYFYQKNGFQIYEVNPNRIVEKQGELLVGFAGVPCRDEIRLRWNVPV